MNFKSRRKEFVKSVQFMAEKMLSPIPDSLYLRLLYLVRTKNILHLKNPRTFNEKLQWLKLHDRNPEYTDLADKYEVRKYVDERIGGQYLIPLLGVWNAPEEIDFTMLPPKYVLKCTHDSGGVFVCDGTATVDYKHLMRFFKKRMKRNYYYSDREWPYKNIRPRIIAEENISSDDGADLRDYKFMCYEGRVKYIFTCSNRKKELYVDFFDTEWHHLPFERHYPNSPERPPRPDCLDEMLQVAEALSEGLNFVRVDLYDAKGKVYFGELTFFPGSGIEEFTPRHWDEVLGRDLRLARHSG